MFKLTTDTPAGSRYTQRVIHTLAAGLCSLLLAPAAWSAPLVISDSPLFLASGVRPNVFLELDDSGSMDWEILTKKYWSYCEYDRNALIDPYDSPFDVCNADMRDNGLWQSHSGGGGVYTETQLDYEYIYSNSDASYNQGCTSSRQTLYACNASLASNTPYRNDWRILSSDFNVLYYNPKSTYLPWLGPCDSNGTACVNASFNSARSNPRNGTTGYSLTRNLNNFSWEAWVDDRGYTGTRPYRGNEINATSIANGEIDLWDKHLRYEIDGDIIRVTTTTYAPDSSGLNPVVTSTILSGDSCFTELVNDPVNPSSCRTIAETKQNVANWYQYARKRQFVAKSGISTVMNLEPGFRYGLDTINRTADFFEVPRGLGNFAAHNENLLDELYSFAWPARGTPLRLGLQRAGNYFDHDGANNLDLTNPVEYSCQKNFTVLITDGYWNGNEPGVGDRDADSFSNTVADVARLYYDHDLDTGMSNDVEPDASDPVTYQHMVSYTIAFGVEGDLQDTDPPGTTVGDPPIFGQGSGWPNPTLTESGNWGDPTSCPASECAEKIDDLWHAAYNSRGTYIPVKTPGDAVAALKNTLRNIQARTGSASSVALSSGAIQTDTKLYQARFVDTDWHGELLSIPVGSDGTPNTGAAIDAGVNIQPADDRIMMTYNGKQGVLFEWDSSGTDLSNAQKADLNTNALGNTDMAGMQRLAWLRGNQSNEKQNGGVFRNRPNSLLADIVNSAPTYVGPPDARYPDIWSGGSSAPENCGSCQSYSTFRQAYATRTPMVYVGTNGGTLNGFNADFTASPVEKLAYVPGKVFENLSQLTDPEYTHHYYVDGTPTIVDAFFSGGWHSVLAGGLNGGGQGIYALEVTDPRGFAATDTSAERVVLWEFTDDDDRDLGFSYSRPAIVRLHNGKWAAVFGNGYNNRDNDGDRSSTGHAVLFIVDIETGKLIRKIDTRAGSTTTPNGLATPAVVDSNGDFIADSVYAGDLEGNLWKFDITGSNKSNWDVAFHDGSGDPEPLFIATDSDGNRQPITVRPDVGRGPNGLNNMLYFGTGLYLQTADLVDTSKQTFYGILDTETSFTGRASLTEQTVIFQGTFNGINVRLSSNEPAAPRGWFMDLPDTGERSISNPILRGGRIIFTTISPDADVCNSGGSSWLMELNALYGNRLSESPFDLNNDGAFTIEDFVPVNFDVDGDGDIDADDRLPVSGKGFDSLIPTPGILTDSETGDEFKYTPNSTGGLEVTRENPGKSPLGRQSWGQLR